MARYFLDTNVLLGYSFLQNYWQDHSSRLFETGNSVYIGETVLYEYCVKTNPGPPSESVNIDWSHDGGILGDEHRRLRKAKRLCDLDLRSFSEEELTKEVVAEMFIDKFDVEDAVAPKVHVYFEQSLMSSCTVSDARNAIDELVNTIISTSQDRKTEMASRVQYSKQRKPYTAIETRLKRLIYGDDESYGPDASLLRDAYELKERRILNRVVTGDKGDIYLNREQIDAITGLSVLYLKDEFANKTAK